MTTCTFCPSGMGLYPMCPRCGAVPGKKAKKKKVTRVRDTRTAEQRLLEERLEEIAAEKQRIIDENVLKLNHAVRRPNPEAPLVDNWLGSEHSDVETLEQKLLKNKRK